MGRNSIIQFYTTEENEQRLQEQADAANTSLSEYCHQVVEEHISEKQHEQQKRRYSVEQQVELKLDEIRSETSTLLSTFQSERARLEHMQRLRTIYVMALWRLLRNDYSQSKQEEALNWSVNHVGQEPIDDPELRPLLTSTQESSSNLEPEKSDTLSANTSGGDSQ